MIFTIRNAAPRVGGSISHSRSEVSSRDMTGGVESVTQSSVVTIEPKSITVGGSPSKMIPGRPCSSYPVTIRRIAVSCRLENLEGT